MSDPTSRRHPNVVNVDELESSERLSGTRFGGAAKPLATHVGAKSIGCNLFEIPPGRALCPFHWHAANEESIYVLQGSGTLRIGEDEVAIRAGDYIGFPVGPASAHELRNTAQETLRYLCLSTKQPTEVVGYPDSNKIGALAVAPDSPPWPNQDSWVASWFPADAKVPYFDGEDTGEDPT